MAQDVRQFVFAWCVLKIKCLTSLLLICCSLCPFPLVLGHTWPFDFVSGLPPLRDDTVILTVVDHLSKAAHFISLAKLPSTKKTLQVVVDHVFRIHGLSVDVVFDKGPQFVSWFWKEFCRQISASMSLSSGFHPQITLSQS